MKILNLQICSKRYKALLAACLIVSACTDDPQTDLDVGVATSALKDRTAPSNGDQGSNVDSEDRRADSDLSRGKRQAILPQLNCVEVVSSRQLQAHWGYNNPNRSAVRRKIGSKNRFNPTPENRGQPTLFSPGQSRDVFITTFSSNVALTWQLDGNRAAADRNSPRCPNGSAGSGSVDACATCEMAPHSLNGIPNTNCSDSLNRCNALTGVTTAGPTPGVSRAALCNQVVSCIHTTHCDAGLTPSDCLCGAGVDPFECFNTRTFAQATGACKDVIAAAAESTNMGELSTRFFDPEFASGSAEAVIETCDEFFCASECLGSVAHPQAGNGAAGAAGGGAGGAGGGGALNACSMCEMAPHTINGQANTNCADSLNVCNGLSGVTSGGPTPGVSKASLCNQVLSCVHSSHCAAGSVTDCLCGAGVDPFDCFSTRTFAQATGACKDVIASAAETTNMNDLSTRFFDPSFASGAADAVIETCDQFFCTEECLTGAVPTAGSGAAGAAGGGAGGTCHDCETSSHGSNRNCTDSLARCDSLTGNTSGGPMPGVAKSQLCHQVLDCVHASHCGITPTDCLCGKDVDPNTCFNQKTFADATGPCKDIIAAAAESTNMNTLATRFFDSNFASGAADAVVETCDAFFCSNECLL